MIFILSQGLLVLGIMVGIFEDLYKYISHNPIVAVKISTVIILIMVTYFIVGYLLLSFSKIYKCLYKIEDKNTKSDLLISYFIISMYMTILLIFPEKFGENYKIGLVGVALSYLLNLKVLLKIIRSPEILYFNHIYYSGIWRYKSCFTDGKINGDGNFNNKRVMFNNICFFCIII